MIQEVMTANQLAGYLQINEQTIYRKVNKGQIPSIHIGKTIRFKKDVIDTWLRLSSLHWSSQKRKKLRDWAEGFAQTQGLTENIVQKAIHKRRHSYS